MSNKRPSNRKTTGPTLAFLVGYISYKRDWGFVPSPDYSTDDFWDYVQGYETALAEAQS